MATERNQEEIRLAKIAAMGPELGELHYLLWYELTWLHWKWNHFRALFATDESRIALMNDTAPAFFVRLEELLWQDVLLHLSRLADPPGTPNQRNVTFRALVRALPNGRLRDEVNVLLDRVEQSTLFARDWRNRYYAHRELNHAVSPEDYPLRAASRAAVEEALAAMGATMNKIELHHENSESLYRSPVDLDSTVYPLLWFLDRGRDAHSRGSDDWEPKFS